MGGKAGLAEFSKKSQMDITKIYLKAGKNAADPEKVVFPTILFINSNHPAFEDVRRPGFMICLGWWDYSIKFGVFF